MTGEEFLNKIRSIKQITGLEWEIVGEILNADVVKVKVFADDEEFSVLMGYPKTTIDIEWIQQVSLNLLLNKIADQTGKKNPFDISSNPVEAINFAINILKGGKDHDKRTD